MLLPKFDFHEPKTLHEACQILAEYGTKAKLIAGGTDLMVNMKKKILSPQQVVSISRIGELKKLDTIRRQHPDRRLFHGSRTDCIGCDPKTPVRAWRRRKKSGNPLDPEPGDHRRAIWARQGRRPICPRP